MSKYTPYSSTLKPLARAIHSVSHSSLFVLGLAVAITSSQVLAAPGIAQIEWMESNYALTEVNQSAIAYADLVISKEFVSVPVSWNKWSGDDADQVIYKLNGHTVVSENISSSQTGSTVLDIAEGGQFALTVDLCNADGCSSSPAVNIVVADTDGSHTNPIELSAGENNQPYSNSSDSVVGAYFVEWGVYGREFPVDRLPAYNLTHVLYGFIPMCGGTGINDSLASANSSSYAALQNACAGSQDYEVVIHDPWAALQKPAKGQTYSTPYKGNYGQLMELKQAYPDLKILPSVGGWTFSDPFFAMADDQIRARFIASLDRFLRTWKFFDGIDIDWEFPGGKGANPTLGNTAIDGATYVTLMREIRQMMDVIEADTGRSLSLSSAISADPEKIAVIDYQAASQYLDHIFLMSYDYYGAWSNTELGHQTALHDSPIQPSAHFNASVGAQALIDQGVESGKIILGAAMYGRGWKGVSNYSDTPFSGTATGPIDGTWENGVLDYRAIVNELTDFEYHYDAQAEAPYLFKPSTGELVTYDDPRSVKAKGNHVILHALGGLFAWEIDADNGDILNAMHEGLGHGENADQNNTPVAKAGADKTVNTGDSAVLDASNSYDMDGDNLTYQWQQIGSSNIVLNHTDQAQADFIVPEVTEDSIFTFELSVSDGEFISTDQVRYTVLSATENAAPVLSVVSQVALNAMETTVIRASATDADGDSLNYTWVVDSELSATNQNTQNLSITAPDVAITTQYIATITVDDGTHQVSQQVNITVNANNSGSCTNADPDANNHPAWDNSSIYVASDIISHNDLVWKAKWWVQGSEPSVSNEAWELLSQIAADWKTNVAYNSSDEVNHDGLRWSAKWWTKGEQPGVADVWVEVGTARCN